MKERPNAWTESMLVAYVDGELDQAQAAAVEAAIRDDPEALAIVQMMRQSKAVVKAAFDRPLRRPVPPGLQELLGANVGSTSGPSIVPLARQRQWKRLQPLFATAASIVILLIGYGAGRIDFGGGVGKDEYRPAGIDEEVAAILRHALEDGSPGKIFSYQSADRQEAVIVVGPVMTTFGECTEFRHDSASGTNRVIAKGLACRSADGTWAVLTLPPSTDP